MTELENRAHAQKALISSDAVRYFMQVTEGSDRDTALDTLIADAKTSFMAENGWVVINLPRLESLLDEDETAQVEDTTPTSAGSLAEAMVLGDVVSAFALIAHRPMVALADATAELDALYRHTQGANLLVSNLLKSATADMSPETIKDAVTALASALDGTYESEAVAVKTAIMKAITILS